MRRLILISLSLMFAYSCSSTQNSKMSSVSNYEDEDLSWVENEDFNPVEPLSYNMREDFFMDDLYEDDSLSKESVERAPKNILNKVERSSDPISQLISLCYQGESQKASALMDEIYEKYKEHPGYWNQIGTCYLNEKKYNRAELYYNKAIDIEKDYAPAVNNMGVIYYRQGQYQKALAAFEKAAQVNQFSLTPSFNLAQIYLQFGFIDDAQRLYQALWRQSSTDKDVLNGLATIYLQKKDIRQSLRLYQEMDSRDLSDPSVGLNYALALKLANQTDEARSALSRIRSSDKQEINEYARRVQRYVGD